MQSKLLEIRDEHVFIPVIAIQYERNVRIERYLISYLGIDAFEETQTVPIILIPIDSSTGVITHACDLYPPDHWDEQKTMAIAHDYISKNWHQLITGDVVDIEIIETIKSTDKYSRNSEAR